MSDIVIHNAKVHNLRGIDVTIPRDSLTVVTGLSGSGKSSLAFDTLYAEGQRRYVESLSAYARQFLDRMQKPDVEKIEGLSPAISIEQRTTSGNPRSIVATVTEIHDYLRILYGSIAVAHCPKCGKPVVKQSAEQIVESIIRGHEVGASRSSLVGATLTPLATADAARFARGIRDARGRVGDASLPDVNAGRKIIIYAPLVRARRGGTKSRLRQ
jgi:excinuclease UvrABC ATPase subunit